MISLKLLSGYRNTRACGFFIIINIMMISILSFACRRSAIGFGLVPVSSARGFVSPGTPNAVEGQGRYGPSENNGFMWESDNRSGRQIQETIEALRRAEQKYRSIFEHAAEGIFQTTPDGQYLSAYQNSHCEASAGDLVVLFTNGLFEVEMADDEYYGAERLLAAVCKQISLPTCQLFGQVVAEIRRSWGLTTLRLLRLHLASADAMVGAQAQPATELFLVRPGR